MILTACTKKIMPLMENKQIEFSMKVKVEATLPPLTNKIYTNFPSKFFVIPRARCLA